MKQSEMIKLLKQNGFLLKREGKEHAIYWNPQTKREVQIPRSKKELKTGTANKILKDAGLK
ncbi:MAG: type II toxin-antitoxin system HicA family toxin [Firmicutes bacterium]|nr:type II toxin-antitoxin system HicA family toxin [Bacillota bacterium]